MGFLISFLLGSITFLLATYTWESRPLTFIIIWVGAVINCWIQDLLEKEGR